jgi:hypothetical protein
MGKSCILERRMDLQTSYMDRPRAAEMGSDKSLLGERCMYSWIDACRVQT